MKHARRRIEKIISFFPGYMFVFLDLERDRWRSVNSTIGVRALVMQGGFPSPCPTGLVENFQKLTDADGIMDVDGFLVEGSSVRITSGPFADVVCTLVCLDRADRARVLLKLLHGDVIVTMSKSLLAPAAG